MGRVLRFFLCIAVFPAFSQIGPRVWQDHLSLNRCISVTKLGSKIYAANNVGIVWFEESELSPVSLTKINGLNDVGVKLLRANPYNNKLLVLYENCNMDVIDINQKITNYADFKLKVLNGKKTINEATFYNKYAYLACGFGIVQFDTDKMEVKETFIIGPGGADLEVYQIALTDSLIFAATPNGVYRANHQTKDLTNYSNWQLVSALPAGAYSGIVQADGKVVTAYSPYKADPSLTLQDTLYIFNNNTWSKFNPTTIGYTVKRMCMASGELFSFVDQLGLKVLNVNTAGIANYVTSFNGNTDFKVVDAYFGKDHLSNLAYWVADMEYGLYQTYSYYPFYKQYPVRRAGINLPLINNIDIFEGKLAISPSHPDDGGGSIYTDQGLNLRRDGDWTYLKTNDMYGGRVLDITYVLYDRKDKTKMWASSWFNGLMEFKNDKLIAVYNATNSPMSEANPGNPRCSGLSMDSDGNLWFANSDVSNYISVRKKNGSFQTYNMQVGRFTRKILVDRNNYVWAIHEREGGITVLKHNNFGVPETKLLTKDVGSGNIQSNSVFSIAEDKDGKIWIGTAAGIAVFYNPTSIFNSSSYDAQPIKIVQDGNVELLLSKEVVTSIVVDGANNKWVGTQTGGVYCFSSDGLTELYHFTKDNSPLYSNFVMDLNYDETTGDVYFGTDIGLQSFRSPILEGGDQYSNVYAYPNPVRPKYQGTVFVRGLVDNSIVQIVDESGNIVWETKSHGGQIEWNITSFSGNRVTPGVYVVYAMTTDGEQKAATKILVVN